MIISIPRPLCIGFLRGDTPSRGRNLLRDTQHPFSVPRHHADPSDRRRAPFGCQRSTRTIRAWYSCRRSTIRRIAIMFRLRCAASRPPATGPVGSFMMWTRGGDPMCDAFCDRSRSSIGPFAPARRRWRSPVSSSTVPRAGVAAVFSSFSIPPRSIERRSDRVDAVSRIAIQGQPAGCLRSPSRSARRASNALSMRPHGDRATANGDHCRVAGSRSSARQPLPMQRVSPSSPLDRDRGRAPSELSDRASYANS